MTYYLKVMAAAVSLIGIIVFSILVSGAIMLYIMSCAIESAVLENFPH